MPTQETLAEVLNLFSPLESNETKVSYPQHCRHVGPDPSLLRGVLGPVRCLAASLASTFQTPLAHTPQVVTTAAVSTHCRMSLEEGCKITPASEALAEATEKQPNTLLLIKKIQRQRWLNFHCP